MSNENIIVKIDNTAACQVKASVTVTQAELKATFDKVVKEFSKFAQIPGFRKGKAPKAMIVKAYEQNIVGEVQERVTKAGYEQVFTQNPEIKPSGYPKMVQGEFSMDADYTFEMAFDLEPTLELGDYKSIKVAVEEVEVTDAEVTDALKELQERQKRIEKASDDVESKLGDMLKLSYEGKVDGEVDESAERVLKAEESWMMIGDPEMVPGIKESLVGVKAGETVVDEVEFSADFYQEALAGKKATYTFKIDEVHTSILPEINDEFAQQAGLKDVADLEEKIKDSLLQSKKAESENKAQEEAVNALLAITGDFDVSPTQVAEELKNLKEKPANADKEDAELEAEAKKRVQGFYALLELAKAEKVEVTPQEMEDRIKVMSYYSQKSPSIMQKQLQKEGRLGGVAMEITLDKTVKCLMDIATGADSAE